MTRNKLAVDFSFCKKQQFKTPLFRHFMRKQQRITQCLSNNSKEKCLLDRKKTKYIYAHITYERESITQISLTINDFKKNSAHRVK